MSVSIADMRAEVLVNDVLKKDYHVMATDIQMVDAGNMGEGKYPKISFPTEEGYTKTVRLTPHSWSQMCQWLKPMNKGKGLFEDPMNPGYVTMHLFGVFKKQYPDREFLVRTNGNRAVAVLSKKYRVLNNRDITEGISESGLFNNMVIQKMFLTDDIFVVRISDPNSKVSIDGQPVFIGLDIANSETGYKRTSVSFNVYQMWCSNGAVIHLGGGMIFEEPHKGNESPESVVFRMNQAIYNSVGLFGLVAEIVVDSRDNRKEAWQLITDAVRDIKGMTDEMKDAIEEKILVDIRGETTPYQVFSAITNVAQRYAPEQRREIEVAAGNFLQRQASNRGIGEMPRAA